MQKYQNKHLLSSVFLGSGDTAETKKGSTSQCHRIKPQKRLKTKHKGQDNLLRQAARSAYKHGTIMHVEEHSSALYQLGAAKPPKTRHKEVSHNKATTSINIEQSCKPKSTPSITVLPNEVRHQTNHKALKNKLTNDTRSSSKKIEKI